MLTSDSSRDVGSYLTLTCMFLYVHFRHLLIIEGESGKGINTDLDSVIKTWHVYVGYIVINAFAFAWNCYARWLPVIAQVSLFTSLISFFVIMVTVPAKASPHQDARFVFANFVNATGWNQNGIGTYELFESSSFGNPLLSIFNDKLAYSLASFTKPSTDMLYKYRFSQIQPIFPSPTQQCCELQSYTFSLLIPSPILRKLALLCRGYWLTNLQPS